MIPADQLSVAGQSISPRVAGMGSGIHIGAGGPSPSPSPRRNSIGTASPVLHKDILHKDPHINITPSHSTNASSTSTTPSEDKLRNLHGRALARNTGNMAYNKSFDSPISRFPHQENNLIIKTPSQSKLTNFPRSTSSKFINSPIPSSPTINEVSLDLHEIPTNYSLEEEANATSEAKSEADFASFLHNDGVHERYLTPTPGKKSRYDDLQLSLDNRDPNGSPSQILGPVDESDEIPEELESDFVEKLDEELGITPRQSQPKQDFIHTISKPTEAHLSTRTSPMTPPRTPLTLPTTPKSGRASPFNIHEFKKSLAEFNKEHSLTPLSSDTELHNLNNKQNSSLFNSQNSTGSVIHVTDSINNQSSVKHVHAATVIQDWWRQLRKEVC